MKKGFTIVELLATIIILGIIGTIGVAIFDNVVHNMRIKAYKTQKESIVLSSQKWLSDQKGTDNFPLEFPYKLYLKELLNQELIEKDICNQEDRLLLDYDLSYVEIKENGLNYDYQLNIVNKKEECK